MDSSSLLILMERVLTGRPGDPDKHYESYQSLHSTLLSTSEATLRASLITIRDLSAKGRILPDVYSKFSQYLTALIDHKKPIPPNLSYLTFSVNPTCQRTAILFHALNKISFKRSYILKKGLDSFKLNRLLIMHQESQRSLQRRHNFELKQQKLKLFIANAKKLLAVNKEKTLQIWRYKEATPESEKFRIVLEKANVRWHYLKYIATERWFNEAWTEQEVIEECWEDEEFYQKLNKKKVKKKESWQSIDCANLEEIVMNVTEKAEFMRRYDCENRVLALSTLFHKKADLKVKTEKVIQRFVELHKQRKQLPITMLSKWADRSSVLTVEALKYSQGLLKLSGLFNKTLGHSLLSIQRQSTDNWKFLNRYFLKQLVNNSVAIAQAPKISVIKMRDYESRYWKTNVKYVKSIMSSVFKSSKIGERSAFLTWRSYKTASSYLIKKEKSLHLIQFLNNSIKDLIRLPLTLPSLVSSKDFKLGRSLILVCKHLRCLLDMSFGKWMRINGSQVRDRRKIKGFAVKGLNNLLRKSLQSTLGLWRKKIDYRSRGERLANLLRVLPNPRLKDCLNRIQGPRSKVCLGLSIVFQRLITAIHQKFSRWKLNIVRNKEEEYYVRMIANILMDKMQDLPKSSLRNSFERILGIRSRTNNAILKVFSLLGKTQKKWFDRWKSNMEQLKELEYLVKIKAEIMSNHMKNIPKIVLKNYFARLLGPGEHASRAIRILFKQFFWLTKKRIDQWRIAARRFKEYELQRQMHAEILIRKMMRVPSVSLSECFTRILGPAEKVKGALSSIFARMSGAKRLGISNWKAFTNHSKRADVKKTLMASELINFLKRLPLRTLNSSFIRLFSIGFRTRASISSLFSLLSRIPKKYFSTWTLQLSKIKNAERLRFQKALIMKNQLAGLPSYKFRDTFNRILGPGHKIGKSLLILAKNGLQYERKAFSQWHRNVRAAKERRAYLKRKGEGLLLQLRLIAHPILNDSLIRLIGPRYRVHKALSILFWLLTKLKKSGFDRWKIIPTSSKLKYALLKLKGTQLQAHLRLIPAPILQTAMALLKGPGSMVKSSLTSLFSKISQIKNRGFHKWKSLINLSKQRNLKLQIKGQKLLNKLTNLPFRFLKDSYDRLFGPPEYAYRAMHSIIHTFFKLKKELFNRWKTNSAIEKELEYLKLIKGERLINRLSLLPNAFLKSYFDRIIGPSYWTHNSLSALVSSLLCIGRKAFGLMKSRIAELKKQDKDIEIRGQNLWNLLKNVPRRLLTEYFERLIGPGYWVGKAINGMFRRFGRLEGQAFGKWKIFTLKRREVEYVKVIKAEKLVNSLKKVPNTFIRNYFQRMLGPGYRVDKSISAFFTRFLSMKKQAFSKWKQITSKIKEQQLLTIIRGEKVLNSLRLLPTSLLKSCFSRILGPQSKAYRSVSNVVGHLLKIQKQGYTTWRTKISKSKEQGYLSKIRGEKLRNLLQNLPYSTLRVCFDRLLSPVQRLQQSMLAFQTAFLKLKKLSFFKWKSVVLKIKESNYLRVIRGSKMINRMMILPNAFLKNYFDRILGPGFQVENSMVYMINSLLCTERQAFSVLKVNVVKSKEEEFLRIIKGQKLFKVLGGPVKAVMNEYFQRLIGPGYWARRAIDIIFARIQMSVAQGFRVWKLRVVKGKELQYLNKIRAAELLGKMSKVGTRVMRIYVQRLQLTEYWTKRVSGVITAKFTHDARGWIQRWIKGCLAKKAEDYKNKVRAEKFVNTLRVVPNSTLKKGLMRIIGLKDCAMRLMLAVKNRVLRTKKQQIETWKSKVRQKKEAERIRKVKAEKFLRLFKSTEFLAIAQPFQRLLGPGAQIDRALKSTFHTLSKKQARYFYKWKSIVSKAQTTQLHQQLTARQFLHKLYHLPNQILRNSLARLMGPGFHTRYSISLLFSRLFKDELSAFNKWKSFCFALSFKTQRTSLIGERLAKFLIFLPQRQLKFALLRIISASNLLKRVFDRLELHLQARTQSYLSGWRLGLQLLKKEEAFKHIRSLNLKNILSNIPNRRLKLSFHRMTSVTNKIVSSLSNLYYSAKRMPKHAFDMWRLKAERIRKSILLNRLKAEKMCANLKKMQRKTLRSAFIRTLGTSPKVRHALMSVVDRIKLKVRKSITIWKEFKNECERFELFRMYLGQKVELLLTNTLNRRALPAFRKVTRTNHMAENVIRHMRSVFNNKLSKIFHHWKDSVVSCENESKVQRERSRRAIGKMNIVIMKAMKAVVKRVIRSRVKEKILRLVRAFKKIKPYFRVWIESKNKWLKTKPEFLKAFQRLQSIPKRELNRAFGSIVFWQDKLKMALLKLNITHTSKHKYSFFKWKALKVSFQHKSAIKMWQVAKLKEILYNLIKTPLRNSVSRLIEGGSRIEKAISDLVSGLTGIPRKALRRWIKKFNDIKHFELFNTTRSQKTANFLQRIPRKTFHCALKRILSAKIGLTKARIAVKTLDHLLTKQYKPSIEIWKSRCIDFKTQQVFKKYNMRFISICLERVLKRTMRAAADTLSGQKLNIEKGAKIIKQFVNKIPHKSFDRWINYSRWVKDRELIMKLKCKMAQSALRGLWKKIIRDSIYRILGGGDKIKGTIKGLVHGLNNIPKVAINRWYKTVQLIKIHEVKLNLKALKFQALMKQVVLRTMNDPIEIIKNFSYIPAELRSKLMALIRRRPKAAFDKWKKYMHIMDKNYLIEQLRETKLQLLLTKISTRILRDCYMRILGEGNRIKGAFKIYLAAIIRKPKNAFDRWKRYIFNVQRGELIDGLRCLRLRNKLAQVVIRRTRELLRRILGEGNVVKGAIQSIVFYLSKAPMRALGQWGRYVRAINEKKLLSGLRTEKLRANLGRVVMRSIKLVFNKLTQIKANALAMCVLRLEGSLKSAVFYYFRLWKDALYTVTKLSLQRTIVGQRLERVLQSLVYRTSNSILLAVYKSSQTLRRTLAMVCNRLKSYPKSAISKWKRNLEFVKRKSMQSELATEKLKNSLNLILNKSNSEVLGRIIRKGDRSTRVLQNLTAILRMKPKIVLKRWHSYVQKLKGDATVQIQIGMTKLRSFIRHYLSSKLQFTIDNMKKISLCYAAKQMHLRALKKLLILRPKSYLQHWRAVSRLRETSNKPPELRGYILQQNLEKMIKRKNKARFKAAQGIYKFLNKLKTSMRILSRFPKERIHFCFNKLKHILVGPYKNRHSLYLSSQKLSKALERISRRKLKDSTQRIIGEGNLIKGALKTIVNSVLRKPQRAFERWKKYISDLRTKMFANKLRGQKLKEFFSKISTRTIRSICSLLFYNNEKVKNVLNTVVVNLTARPRQVIKKWKFAIQAIREKELLGYYRSEKFKNCIGKMMKRTEKELLSAVADSMINSKIINYKLKLLNKICKKKPRSAVETWKAYVEDAKRIDLINYVRSQRLMQALGRITKKNLRDTLQRVFGEGDKVKGALKKIFSLARLKQNDAFLVWKKHSNLIKNRNLANKLRMLKVKAVMDRVAVRKIRAGFTGMTKDNAGLKAALKAIKNVFKGTSQAAIQLWKQAVQLNNQAARTLRAGKLRELVEKVCRKTLREATRRLIYGQGRDLNALRNLKSINRILTKRPKIYFDIWHGLVGLMNRKEFYDNVTSQKLEHLFKNLPRRALKNALQLMTQSQSHVKAALKSIISRFIESQKKALSKLKEYSDMKLKAQLLDSIKAGRLKDSLQKLAARASRNTYQRLMGSGNRVKGAIVAMLNSLKSKRSHAFSVLKAATQQSNLQKALRQSRGHQLTSTLSPMMSFRSKVAFKQIFHPPSKENSLKLLLLTKAMEFYKESLKSSAFQEIKRNANKASTLRPKSMLLFKTISSLLTSVKKSSLHSIRLVVNCLKKLAYVYDRHRHLAGFKALAHWRAEVLRKLSSQSTRTKGLSVLKRLCRKRFSQIFTLIFNKKFFKRILCSLVKSQSSLQLSAIAALKEHVRKTSLINKVLSVHRLQRMLTLKAKTMQSGRFIYWKNLEAYRIHRIRKKVIMKWIYFTSINYQNSFWKLKYVWNKDYQYFDPNHALVYRKLSMIAGNYQMRLKQYAHFKLVMYYKTQPSENSRYLRKKSEGNVVNARRMSSEVRALAYINRPESRAAIVRAMTPIGKSNYIH